MTHVKWSTRLFGECVLLSSGGTPSTQIPEYWNGEIPWVSSKDMKVGRLHDAQDHVTAEGARNGTRMVSPGTILIVVRSMILAKEFPIAIAMREMAFNQDLKAVVPVSDVDNSFLYYWLLSNSYHIRGIADEAAHGTKRIQTDRLLSLEVSLPPLPAQRRIASILSAYDDLIENNTRRIKLLEQMAQAIYREWFVEFRAPGVKLRKASPEEQKVTGKDRFPVGWEIKPAGELLSYHIGGGWGEEAEGEEFPIAAYVIRGTDIPATRYASTGGVPLRYHKRSNFKPRQLEVGDIVFEVSGGGKEIPVGRSLLVTQRLIGRFDQGVICASFCKLLRPNKEVVLPELLYLHLVDFFESRRIVQFQVQSTGIKNLKFAHFLEGEFVTVPDQATQAKYAEAALPMFDMIQTLGLKNATLRQTRDLLLPRLVGGEIEVGGL